MEKKQSKKDKSLAVRREVVSFLGSSAVRVAGGAACDDTRTDHDPCTALTNCTGTGCTNSWTISY